MLIVLPKVIVLESEAKCTLDIVLEILKTLTIREFYAVS